MVGNFTYLICFSIIWIYTYLNSFFYNFSCIPQAEAKLGISFRAHPTMVNLFLLANVDMGYHYQTRFAVPKVMESISEDMHLALMNNIKEKDDKFGIILDGSTDSSGNHFLAVLFQILEQVRLIAFLHILTNILKQI